VVKNVTGYDLSRGLAGSWGTLAVATELTFKVLPRPEAVTTLVLAGLEPAAAVWAMSAAMGSPADVSGAAYLPAPIAGRIADVACAGAGDAVTLVRLEGFGPSVEARAAHLGEVLAPFARVERLDADVSRILWRAIGNMAPFAAGRGTASRATADRTTAVWRISVAPTAGPDVAAAVSRGREAEWYADWAGGLVWLSVPEEDDAAAADIRAAIAAAGGGHATLIRGSHELRARIAVFQPQDAALAALTRRLKEQFDPKGILNPGRMTAGR
jgi:glycolate oxidase FAD binding subunit